SSPLLQSASPLAFFIGYPPTQSIGTPLSLLWLLVNSKVGDPLGKLSSLRSLLKFEIEG
ncbi:unnamed protein product, partial [Prunus brigantina]